MPIGFNVSDLFADIDKMIEIAGATAAGTDREKEKVLLTAVVEKMKQARKDAAALLPQALDALKAQAEAGLARAERAQAEIEDARKQVEAAAAAVTAAQAAKADRPPPPPPAAPDPGIDPGLGARLRDDLLGSLGVPADTGRGPAAPGKDIWEDWK